MTKPLYLRKSTIGANVRPGRTPGSFSKPACLGKNNSRRARLHPSAVTIKAAAEDALVRHGAEPSPNAFDAKFDCASGQRRPAP